MSRLLLAVALDGAGWHPAAWREPGANPEKLFDPDYWVDVVHRAEVGHVDFVTFEDSFRVGTSRGGVADRRVDRVRGRLDASLVASRVGPVTESIGLVPVVNTTHSEPFHVSKGIATLDWVSQGRAGMQVRVSPTAAEAALFGRRTIGTAGGERVEELFAEAADFVEVVRRLWDSWEDDAEIRDAATGRFIDRDKLHYVDFEGPWFGVRGPSITPRPPQGQPVVSVLAHVPVAFDLAARSADVVFVTPQSLQDGHDLVASVRRAEEHAGRDGHPLRIVADLTVFLDDDASKALERKERLDDLDGRCLASDAHVFVGRPQVLAELMGEWSGAGLDGFRLRPGVIAHDLDAITGPLSNALAEGGVRGLGSGAESFRERLGLPRPPNRYAAARTASPREARQAPGARA